VTRTLTASETQTPRASGSQSLRPSRPSGASQVQPQGPRLVQAGPASFETLYDFPDTDDAQGFDYLRTMNFFNTSRGASEAVGGSFSLPDAAINVLPLKADPAALHAFVSEYLRVDDQMRFEAWGDFVYLVVCDFKHVRSQQSGIASRRAREMSLMVPVKAYRWYSDDEAADLPPWWQAAPGARDAHGRERLLTTGFVNAYTFVDDVETSITANEVFGVPCLNSVIAAGENDWLGRNRGAEFVDEKILSLRSKVLPEIMAGAKAVDREVIEIWGDRNFNALRTHKSRDLTVNAWVSLLARDLARKSDEAGKHPGEGDETRQAEQRRATCAGEGFALGLLAGELPFNQFTLKQFRDSAQAEDACYQALVQRRHTISRIEDISELSGPLHITITDYPTQPIIKHLGLIPKFSYPGPDRLVQVFEPIRPFSFNGNLVRGAGMTLFERLGTTTWQAVDLPEQMFGWRPLTTDLADRLLPEGETDPGPTVLVGSDPAPWDAQFRNKTIAPDTARGVQGWFEECRRTGTAKGMMIRARELDDMVAALTHSDTLDAYDVRGDTDLSAFHAQAMARTPPAYTQSQAAAWIERFSPATIADMVLSRQWGKTAFSRHYPVPYADFCIPVNTVPIPFMECLFPPNERQGQYWPRSEAYDEDARRRLLQETNAFLYALETNLRLLALAFPLAHGPDMEPAEALARVAEAYNARLRGTDEPIGQDYVDKLIQAAEIVGGEMGFGRGLEELGSVFFQRLLPETIRLGYRSRIAGSAGADTLLAEGKTIFSPAEWREVAAALRVITSRLADSLPSDEMIDLDALVARAEANAVSFGQDDLQVPPSELLLARLTEAMAPGLTPGTD